MQRTKEDVNVRVNGLEEAHRIQITAVQQKTEEWCTGIETTVNIIQTRVDSNHERIEGIQRREILRIREEIENIGNRPAVVPTFQHADNREAMNFRACLLYTSRCV